MVDCHVDKANLISAALSRGIVSLYTWAVLCRHIFNRVQVQPILPEEVGESAVAKGFWHDLQVKPSVKNTFFSMIDFICPDEIEEQLLIA